MANFALDCYWFSLLHVTRDVAMFRKRHIAFPGDRADKFQFSFPMKHGAANLMFIYQSSLQMVFCPVAASSVKLP